MSILLPRTVCLFNKFMCEMLNISLIAGMLLTKKRTRSIRSLVGSPEVSVSKLELNDSDISDSEIEQPTKRVALHVSTSLNVYDR